MGPPPFGDGNLAAEENSRWICGTFNGATAFRRWKPAPTLTTSPSRDRLQWGHRLSAMETHGTGGTFSQLSNTFNGATTFRRWKPYQIKPRYHTAIRLQWGHRLSAMETRNTSVGHTSTLTSFNGAIAFRRWKQPGPGVHEPCHGGPSMGPPPFGDGNDSWWGDPECIYADPSMGPPPFGDGNLDASPALVISFDLLQWGHRLSAMETSSTAIIGCSHPPPSMGPPPFGDGNKAIIPQMEFAHSPSMGPPPFGDGNLGFKASERKRLNAFNGATAFRRWKPRVRLLSLGSTLSFNGATAFRRWKPSTSELPDVSVWTLQWGHRLSAMETALCGSSAP